MTISCTNCGRPYPETGLPYRCPVCRGIFDFHPLPFDPDKVDPGQPGMWRYHHTFGLDEMAEPVSLGEGGTPLVWAQVGSRQVAFKCEFLNPTGSFKDRGSALIATWLRRRGLAEAVEDSSGNAGASFAAYATRAGLRARIYVPAAAGGPKQRQIAAYGAELVPIPGTRTQVSDAVRQEAETGVAYASHAHLPFNLPGYATAAFEIYEQLGRRMPGTVIVPAGQGGLLLGLGRGFRQMRIAIISEKGPRLIGVQALACAPLWALSTAGQQGLAMVTENPTLAEGVRVRFPVRGDAVLDVVRGSGGGFRAVDEGAILPGWEALARLGLYVEPTSALVWAALQDMENMPDPVVAVLTGSGFKYETQSHKG